MLIKEWKEWKRYLDSSLEQRHTTKTKDNIEITVLLLVLSVSFAFNARVIHYYFFKVTYAYFAVVMALVTIFWILTGLMSWIKNPKGKAVMRFCSKVIFCFIFAMLAIFLVVYKCVLENPVKKYPKNLENVVTLFAITTLELFACYALFNGIGTLIDHILCIAEKAGCQINEGAFIAFLLVFFLLLIVIVFEKVALHMIRWYKQFHKIPSEQIRYDELFYKCNLEFFRILFLMLLFVVETFLPEESGTINQGDFINALTVWTVLILCNDKRKELCARLEANGKMDENIS